MNGIRHAQAEEDQRRIIGHTVLGVGRQQMWAVFAPRSFGLLLGARAFCLALRCGELSVSLALISGHCPLVIGRDGTDTQAAAGEMRATGSRGT